MKPFVDVACALIHRDLQFLLTSIRRGKPYEGYWEFPGGKVEENENHTDCLLRELDEELGISVRILNKLEPIDFEYDLLKVRLNPFLCEIKTGEPTPLEGQTIEWFDLAEIAENEHLIPADVILFRNNEKTVREILNERQV